MHRTVSGCVMLALALLSAMMAPAFAQSAFPRTQLTDSLDFVAPPEPLARFLETVAALDAAGAFDADSGMEPDPGLGGVPPKLWLLAHLADDLRCERDLGGVCFPESTPDDRISYAVAHLRGTDADGLVVTAEDVATTDLFTAPWLQRVSLDVSLLRRPLVEQEDGRYCTATLRDMDQQRFNRLSRIAEQMDSTGLDGWARIWGVLGGWRLRTGPGGGALGGVRDEIVIADAAYWENRVEEPRSDGAPRTWWPVTVFTGNRGVIAAPESDILTALDPAFCFRVTGNRAELVTLVGGGD